MFGMDRWKNIKKGVVCNYYKGTLAVKMISIPHLNESRLYKLQWKLQSDQTDVWLRLFTDFLAKIEFECFL